ncbi:MAG TPA: dihydrolipoyllysine-residue acetyltransferase [Candidatus Acidoferrales bacterium]|nr:dihydrolipoyllysine-residue acetyltransferase [Candidatus Acidoferrales bacterium]
MASAVEIKIPNIGDFKDVPVIDVLVKAGDKVEVDSPLVTVESEKASMDIPSPSAGVVESVSVKVGDKVSEGSTIVRLASGNGAAAAPAQPAAATQSTQKVNVPNIGDFKDVPIIEVLVKPGDTIAVDSPLVTIESEKASMDVPSPVAGTIASIDVKVGDKVSEGSPLLTLTASNGSAAAPAAAPVPAAAAPAPAAKKTEPAPAPAQPPLQEQPAVVDGASVHASPSIRRFARELGVDLRKVQGTAPHGRVTKEDVQNFVKKTLASPAAAVGGGAMPFALPAWPKIDFAQFGPIERQPLSRIKKISGPSLHRNWVSIPHVTNNDEADITDLEAFRKQVNAEDPNAKLTILAFVMKALVAVLKRYPDFNSSLDGDALILKKYYNIGFAADTPAGLIVPVLKDADKKGVMQIAAETRELAARGRDGKLKLTDMEGSTFTISSLGGIGGTDFTPIVNAPEVAILGLSRSAMKPVWDGKEFVPRLMLPLSLSYDHRVIDGAAGARFNAYLAEVLADMRRTML